MNTSIQEMNSVSKRSLERRIYIWMVGIWAKIRHLVILAMFYYGCVANENPMRLIGGITNLAASVIGCPL